MTTYVCPYCGKEYPDNEPVRGCCGEAHLEPKRVMDQFTACSIAEGFCGGENATEEEQIEAWQYLIDTGACWKLQGWYGRTAMALIENGICTPAPARTNISTLAEV